jgi:branched-chain amino acid transport system substrate-binding protein
VLKRRFLVGAIAAIAVLVAAMVAYGSSGKSGVSPLPTSSCPGKLVQGGGSAQFIIASDLPLQGSSRTQTIEMTEAIQYQLRQLKYKAGKYIVGYQSCDDSTAQAGKWDSGKCSANVQNYVRNKDVIGVIGTFNSGCAEIEVPIANRASLGYVSPANTYVGLTHSAPGVTSAGEPGKYYPTGKRNYIRVVAADDFQGAADAILAKGQGVTKVYILNDKEAYGAGIAGTFRNAAKRLNLQVVGDEAWDPKAASYEALAGKIKNAGAQAVFLGGLECENGGKLIKDLRAGIGDAKIIAPDGFSSFSDTISHAGSASDGMYISIAGQPNTKVKSGAGKAFIKGFGKVIGRDPNPYSLYGAQAASVMMLAIAKSNGTRASVTSNLFKTRVIGGILGSFVINKNGDTNLAPISVYLVKGGKATFFRVITPPASLVAAA